jgi:ABC-type glycerol-3-phosphate transport system substrate-binding protein
LRVSNRRRNDTLAGASGACDETPDPDLRGRRVTLDSSTPLHMKKLIVSLLTAGLLACSTVAVSAQTATAPKSVIHVVTVTWKATATPEQVKAALDGAQKLPAAYPGITRVWTKTLKAQGDRKNAIVMEFASEQALKDYTDSAAQKEWYQAYLPVRERSTTFDVTNE